MPAAFLREQDGKFEQYSMLGGDHLLLLCRRLSMHVHGSREKRARAEMIATD